MADHSSAYNIPGISKKLREKALTATARILLSTRGLLFFYGGRISSLFVGICNPVSFVTHRLNTIAVIYAIGVLALCCVSGWAGLARDLTCCVLITTNITLTIDVSKKKPGGHPTVYYKKNTRLSR